MPKIEYMPEHKFDRLCTKLSQYLEPVDLTLNQYNRLCLLIDKYTERVLTEETINKYETEIPDYLLNREAKEAAHSAKVQARAEKARKTIQERNALIAASADRTSPFPEPVQPRVRTEPIPKPKPPPDPSILRGKSARGRLASKDRRIGRRFWFRNRFRSYPWLKRLEKLSKRGTP